MSKNLYVNGKSFNEVDTKLKELLQGKEIKVINKQYYTDFETETAGVLLVYNEDENIEGGEN